MEAVYMVTITFPDRETEKRALAFLLGRFSGRALRSGEHLVPEAALEALADQNIEFTVRGKAAYERQKAATPGEPGKSKASDPQIQKPGQPSGELVTEHLPSAENVRSAVNEGNAASIALLQSWLAEDATNDPAEIREAQKELDEFKRAINAERERAGARLIYP
jgi:hypothetical protein